MERTLLGRVTYTAVTVTWDNAQDIANAFIVPKVVGSLKSFLFNKVGRPASAWLLARYVSEKAADGSILAGINLYKESGAKFALRKGLPVQGQRTLAIENNPHVLDNFSGEISSGYGKGRKTLIYRGPAILKIADKRQLVNIEYHVHQAARAGLHYDLAVATLPEKVQQFELNIGKGPVKGRYAFVQTDRGYIVTPMKDNGVIIPKPQYKLKPEELLKQFSHEGYIVERKLDGSLGNVLVKDQKAIIHSHRDSASSYYDKLPALEDLSNHSRWVVSRSLFTGPELDGTVFKVELIHPRGVSVVSGILNSSPDNAIAVQKKIGPVTAHIWDVVKFNGKKVEKLSYVQRREIVEEIASRIRLFNRNWQAIERCPDSLSFEIFYQTVLSDVRGLPFSEGVVVKDKAGVAEDSWIKVKRHDLVDMEILDFLPGEGRLANSLGSLRGRDLETGNIAVIGTGFSDFERDWIWQHKDLLHKAVVKAKVFAATKESLRAARFIEFHADKNNEAPLLMYSDVLAGLGDRKAMLSVKHALINRGSP